MMKLIITVFIGASLIGCTSMTKKEQKSESNDPPRLLKPVVKKIWIKPEIRNGGQEWSEGYYIYRIEKETTWSR